MSDIQIGFNDQDRSNYSHLLLITHKPIRGQVFMLGDERCDKYRTISSFPKGEGGSWKNVLYCPTILHYKTLTFQPTYTLISICEQKTKLFNLVAKGGFSGFMDYQHHSMIFNLVKDAPHETIGP